MLFVVLEPTSYIVSGLETEAYIAVKESVIRRLAETSAGTIAIRLLKCGFLIFAITITARVANG